jgi:threonine dehydrogenase-like Zn-dependent dehydrogenase
MAGRVAGYEPVIAIDLVSERLVQAERLGALPVMADSAVESVRRLVGGEDVLHIVEAVGSPSALRLAWELAGPGAAVSVVGVHTDKALALSPEALYDKNVTLSMGRCSARHRLQALTELVAREKLPLASLVTHDVPLAEAKDAYRMFADRGQGCIKAVFRTF